MSGLRIEPGSLDLQFDNETGRWSKSLKMTNRIESGNIVYTMKTSVAEILKFKGPTRGFIAPGQSVEILVSIENENKDRLGTGAIMVTHVVSMEENPDSKVILSQEENLKNAEKRKILVVLANPDAAAYNSQPRRRDFTLNEVGDSVQNLHSQLEQLRKLVYLLIFLILFLILITGCSLIIEKKKLRSEL